MPLEIEIKLQVDSHEPVRTRLAALSATRKDQVEEVNTFFDTPSGTLRISGKGLRLRQQRSLAGAGEKLILTFKGPRQHGPLKSREETELVLADANATITLLAGLGYRPTLTFRKRRDTWLLDACHVELDELVPLGLFVEIEGPSETAVLSVRTRLQLDDAAIVMPTYAELLAIRNQSGSAVSP
jgi:adenylate cyclase, class 2